MGPKDQLIEYLIQNRTDQNEIERVKQMNIEQVIFYLQQLLNQMNYAEGNQP